MDNLFSSNCQCLHFILQVEKWWVLSGCIFISPRKKNQYEFVEQPVSFVSVIFHWGQMDLPHPKTSVRQVCLPFSHPQDKLRMLKPFTHNKTVIKQVTRPHINQLFQRRGPNLHSLSSLLVGGGIFFSGSF